MTATGKKTTIAEVEQWWSQADFTIMEIVTGFQASDFVSETGSQDFVDACNEHWTQMSNEDKIIVRKTFKSLELEKSTITQANKWWDETDFEQMALITGLRQHEFDAEDGYQEFVDACDNYWYQLNNSEKIRVWNKYK